MKAAVYHRYGPPEVVQVEELDTPSPKAGELLIRIHASVISSGDSRMRGFNVNPLMWIPMRLFLGPFRPKNKVLGYTLAGVVEDKGAGVSSFEVGDRVFASAGLNAGAHAEYICLPETGSIVKMPVEMSFAEGSTLPFGPTTALHFLHKGEIQAGQKVLIYGASGSLGTAAVQIAKHYGAEVTAVCSGANESLVRTLGATHVIDYTKEDMANVPQSYDIIFDTVGKSPFSVCVKQLKENGFYLRAVHMELMPLLKGMWVNMTTKKKVIGGVAKDLKEQLVFLKDLYAKGEFKPVIEKQFPLDQVVEAHRLVDSGHKRGDVVLQLSVS